MRRPLVVLALASAFASCRVLAPERSIDSNAPRSVLVLPALDGLPEQTPPAAPTSAGNGSVPTRAEACAALAPLLSEPVAERGYYVPPVAVVEWLLRENGLATPADMHAAPLAWLRTLTGADAVLFVTLHEWGTSPRIMDSATRVTLEARLVDARSGAELWSRRHTSVLSRSGLGGMVGVLFGTVVHQGARLTDPAFDLARECVEELLLDEDSGIPVGPCLAQPGYGREPEPSRH